MQASNSSSGWGGPIGQSVSQAELMATRLRYLRNIIKNIRAEISTRELVVNTRLLHLFEALDCQLRELEATYVMSGRNSF